MLDASLDLWRTTCIVRTVPGGLSLIAHQGGATFWTAFDELDRLCDNRTLIDIDANNLGDDLTTFLHIDVVADMQVEALDEVLVVQGGSFHGSTCQLHRIHIRHRRHSTSAPHLIGHFVETGADALCLELIGDGPAWTLGRETQSTLLAQRVHLQYDTVGSHWQVLSGLIPVIDGFPVGS